MLRCEACVYALCMPSLLIVVLFAASPETKPEVIIDGVKW